MMLHLTFTVGLSDLSGFMGCVKDHPEFFKVCNCLLWFCYENVMICYGFYFCVKSEVSITQCLEGLEQIHKIGY